VTDRDEQQRRIRRNALLLGALALAVYVAYYVIQLSGMAS
jgi:hypothetical protein